MDTTNILFICGGAFVGLEKVIGRRIGKKALGFRAIADPDAAKEGEVTPIRAQRDAELLRRAVENVLRNGIRYSPDHSTIDVSVAEDIRTATIAIRDYGPGVPEHALTQIFDPFFRVEEARNAMGGGSGLGLSIAKQAVQVHHGSITAENASPGLRVQITLPLCLTPTPH